MVICDEAYKELVDIMGRENVSIDPQIFGLLCSPAFPQRGSGKMVPRPAAVVLPGCIRRGCCGGKGNQ